MFVGEGASIVLNCVNVTGTEVPSIIATKERGTLVFFSMATSFARGVLGTDAIGIPYLKMLISILSLILILETVLGKDLRVLMGAGVFSDQAPKTYQILDEVPMMRYLLQLAAGEKADPV